MREIRYKKGNRIVLIDTQICIKEEQIYLYSQALNHIGCIHDDQGNYESALECFSTLN